ncbi:uncharacterized protein EDB93DRAFT_1340533 [Suillus bovinus]|uniref:uncharacterized protein n=1 Tax=Suillus bovinus TaxID=48563 RepID=UPI001B87786C|nr:uncharacterized protein EDB93DRAFT_1340533 [Suillus bovinus]KAG2130170.1 hypothetical protein EDB93DRAFT_1340533 [Suillus bovinus]
MHRRKSSKEDVDDGETFVLIPDNEPTTTPTLTAAPASLRQPQLGPGIPARPPTVRRPPSISLNSPPSSPFRASHTRVRSISSGPFMPPVPSPLANTFHVPLHPFEPGQVDDPPEPLRGHGRRHGRMHSRNLSIFFPRSHATISEDLTSDLESSPNNNSQSRTDLHIPASQSEPLQIGHDRTASFSFGSSGSISKSNSAGAVPASVTARRGHHHKHSLSHNFFSFLDPVRQSQPVTKPEELHTAPTPAPMSPWSSATNGQSGESISSSKVVLTAGTSSPSGSESPAPSPLPYHTQFSLNLSKGGLLAQIACILQFCLGGLVWVRGQAIGSLACTGLGYWVVFDAFGIAVGGPLLERSKGGFCPRRTQTTLLFAQCVYLMFAGVYVAKEAVEHILLSAGQGHRARTRATFPFSLPSFRVSFECITQHSRRYHARPGSARRRFRISVVFWFWSSVVLFLVRGICVASHTTSYVNTNGIVHRLCYPLGLVIIVLLSLLATSIAFEHHDVLVKGRGQAPWERILRNPYALPPILFCVAILGGEMVLDVTHYIPFDLSLATLQVIITTHVAYAACVVLGGVLLQTAPAASFTMSAGSVGGMGTKGMGISSRGTNTPESKMESFWRVVREIERHEHVTSLPAPHVWQSAPGSSFSSVFPSAPRSTLSPSDSSSPFSNVPRGPEPQLIVTLSPHVPSSLCDEEVLKFTRWACEKVRGAFVGDGTRGVGVEVEVKNRKVLR